MNRPADTLISTHGNKVRNLVRDMKEYCDKSGKYGGDENFWGYMKFVYALSDKDLMDVMRRVKTRRK